MSKPTRLKAPVTVGLQTGGAANIPDVVIQKLLDRNNFSFYTDLKNVECKAPTHFDTRCVLTEEEISWLVNKTREIVTEQPMLVTVEAPVMIVGDIHGQFRDLILVLECIRTPPTMNYLFLGDYVDRGEYSLECICLLMAFKVKFPKQMYLLRGNHECASSTRAYGFYQECGIRFKGSTLWQQFMKLFNFLPAAGLAANRQLLCMHGGLSPLLHTLEDIEKLRRPSDIPPRGLLTDLMWSDPDKDSKGWNKNIDRGTSVTFGLDIITKFTRRHNLACIVRAHQVVKAGFQFLANKKLCTIFTAPNYCGVFKNDGACMKVEAPLNATIVRFLLRNKEDPDVRKRCEDIPANLSLE